MKKICVYTICKNEEQFVKRWVDSIKEADLLIVGDTGSTDNTIDELKKLGVVVHELKVTPWRFDVARNMILDLIPDDVDVCISLDMDEVLSRNWRKNLEKCWLADTTRMSYIYNWSFNQNNKPSITFITDKIHDRNSYRWTHPVHEILEYTGSKTEKIIFGENIIIDHHPDPNKSRAHYLNLLELSVKEDSENDRNMHYLGREYMYKGMWNEAITTLKKHLTLKKATWKDERCASMRFIGRSYVALNNYKEAKVWLDKAILEAPYLRDPYVERALLSLLEEDYDNVIYYCNQALLIKENIKTYINEIFSYNHTIYYLLAVSNYYKDNFNEALTYIDLAIKISPGETRLLENKKLIQDKLS